MARVGRARLTKSTRTPMRSPGRPPVGRREDRVQFWSAIARGLYPEAAVATARVSWVVGARWFRQAGGMPPTHLAASAPPLSGRCLTFAEREQLALLRAQGHGVRECAQQLRRALSTISRELHRNAARRSGGAGLHGDHRAVARRSRGEPSEDREAGGERTTAPLCGGAARRRDVHPERYARARTDGGLDRAQARPTTAPSLGAGVEPRADRAPPRARLSG